MKKLLLTLGSIASVIAPITAAISCGEDSKKNKTNTTKTETITPVAAESNSANVHDENNIFAKDFDIKEDGLYINPKQYHGVLWNNRPIASGERVTDKIVPMFVHKWPAGVYRGITQFGDGDSFYAMYNTDDSDGLSVDNLLDTFGFVDTSIARDEEIGDANKKLESIKPFAGSLSGTAVALISHDSTHGELRHYFGAQNNHVGSERYATTDSFQLAIKRLVDAKGIDHEVVTAIFAYYGLSKTKDVNGNYIDDVNIKNHASRGFAPVIQMTPTLTYEILDHRTVKFTWHISTFSATAAKFVFGDNEYGLLSVGDQNEWESYLKYRRSCYVGIKENLLERELAKITASHS